MTRSVTLQVLPAGLTFPADLADKAAYDPAARRLSFRGFMCKGDFDRLTALSNDVEYLKAVVELFQKCVFTDDESPRGPINRLKAVLARIFF